MINQRQAKRGRRLVRRHAEGQRHGVRARRAAPGQPAHAQRCDCPSHRLSSARSIAEASDASEAPGWWGVLENRTDRLEFAVRAGDPPPARMLESTGFGMTWSLAVRGRPVGDRRAARPSDPLAWRRRRAGRRHAPEDRRAGAGAARGGRPRTRRAPARAAGLPWQPLAAGRPACGRRGQRPDAGRDVRQPVQALLAQLRRHRARRPPYPGGAQRARLCHRHAARHRRPYPQPAADGALWRRDRLHRGRAAGRRCGSARHGDGRGAAGGLYPDLPSACLAMQQGGLARTPDPKARQSFDRDYRVFLEMHRQRRELDALQ